MKTMAEIWPEDIASKYGWPCVVPLAGVNTLSELKEIAYNVNPFQLEGYVICSPKFKRFKISSRQAIALKDLKEFNDGGRNRKLMLDLIRTRTDNHEEILTTFPAWRPLYNTVRILRRRFIPQVKEEYDGLCDRVQEIFDKIEKAKFVGLVFED